MTALKIVNLLLLVMKTAMILSWSLFIFSLIR